MSEPAEVQQALKTVSQALKPIHSTLTWITTGAVLDVAAWRTIWEQGEHVVCRIYLTLRIVEIQTPQGEWVQANLAQAKLQVRKLARVQTTRGACRRVNKPIPNGSPWR